jgi:hypothetical protein
VGEVAEVCELVAVCEVRVVVAVCEMRVVSPGSEVCEVCEVCELSEVCEVLLDSSSCGLLEACAVSVLPAPLDTRASCEFPLLPLKGA